MSLSTTQLSEPLLSPHNPTSGPYDFITLKTDYFSYVPTPLDVSKPLLEPEGRLPKIQNEQLIDFTSSAQISEEYDESPKTSVFDCTVSPNNNLNPEDFLVQPWPSETNTTPAFNQASQSAQPPASPLDHNPISPTPLEPVTRKPRRKYRKRKIVSQAVIEQKRDNFLKRNRLAANRYREKKKEWVTELEDKQKEQREANMRLLEEQERLRAEIQKLKSWLSRCTTCNGGTLNEATEEKTG